MDMLHYPDSIVIQCMTVLKDHISMFNYCISKGKNTI